MRAMIIAFFVLVGSTNVAVAQGWPQADDTDRQTRVDALTTMLNAQLQVYLAKNDKVLRFREQMATNVLVFILMAIGGLVVTRSKLRIKQSKGPWKTWLAVAGLCLAVSFAGFGKFYFSIDSSNRIERNFAEIRLASLSRQLAAEAGFEARRLLDDKTMTQRVLSMKGANWTGTPLSKEIEPRHYYEPTHVGVPFKPGSMVGWLNSIGFITFIGLLIVVVTIFFFIVERCPPGGT